MRSMASRRTLWQGLACDRPSRRAHRNRLLPISTPMDAEVGQARLRCALLRACDPICFQVRDEVARVHRGKKAVTKALACGFGKAMTQGLNGLPGRLRPPRRERFSCGCLEQAVSGEDVVSQREPRQHRRDLARSANSELAETPLSKMGIDALVHGAPL